MQLKVLRVTKRAKEASSDIDYADKLSESDREWMEIFLAGHYSNDADCQVALSGSKRKAKEWSSDVNAANYADSADVSSRFMMLPHTSADEDGGGFTKPLLTRPAERCPRCGRHGTRCECAPVKLATGYSPSDYQASGESPEDAYIDRIDAETSAKEPYGTSPQDLKQGHRVVICLPQHYLKDRSGTVLAFRPWTGDYLIEADRPALRNRDSATPQTTLCWVAPHGLKRLRPKLARQT